jgi:alpha-L-fucosidase
MPGCVWRLRRRAGAWHCVVTVGLLLGGLGWSAHDTNAAVQDVTAPAPAGDWAPVLIGGRPEVGTPPGPAVDTTWENPLVKHGKLGSPLVEVTPLVFQGRKYLLENWQKQWEHPGAPDGSYFQKDEIRIRDVATDEIVSVALTGHGLGSALVWEDRVYVFGGDWGTEKKWNIRRIELVTSDDLRHWTEPQTILVANENERFFNVSVCRGPDRFYLLIETDDPQWPAFTFKYFASDDLVNWERIPNALYGREKYVGGPAFYWFDGHFYTLYLESLGDRYYETRVTRSSDLVHWQDAPADRPFVTFDPEQPVHPLRPAGVRERNASDAALCYFGGKTWVYYTGGDQQLAGDLQLATYDGSPSDLLATFYAEPTLPVPSPRQQTYQEQQLGAFIHFGPATYMDSRFMDAADAAVFAPAHLDADQWMRAAKSFGARHIVLTAKHHNGFCLWPTTTTEHSVRHAPWQGGQGDVVREFVDAARRHGLKPGLYLSGGDTHFPCTSTPDPMGQRTLRGDRNAYLPVFLEQLRELLTRYGDLTVMWFDGAYDPFGWDILKADGQPLGPAYGDAIIAMVHDIQPHCAVFNGTRPEVRWSGSEQGWAPYPLWNVIRHGEGLDHWVPPYFEGWSIPEANVHTRATWFWKPDTDHTLKSVDELLEVYRTSIGRGANLLVNMTPDTSGRIPPVEADRLAAFGAAVKRLYASPLAETHSQGRWREGQVLQLTFPTPQTVGHVILEEELAAGQRIRRYRIEALTGDRWMVVAQGESVGRKRIQHFEPVATQALRLRVVETAPLPKLRRFAAFAPPP